MVNHFADQALSFYLLSVLSPECHIISQRTQPLCTSNKLRLEQRLNLGSSKQSK